MLTPLELILEVQLFSLMVFSKNQPLLTMLIIIMNLKKVVVQQILSLLELRPLTELRLLAQRMQT